MVLITETLPMTELPTGRKRTQSAPHPWVNFQLDLTHVTYKLWMLLGEAFSKCQQIAGTPLLPETAEKLNHVFLVKGVHATTSIEGNTLTEEQIEQQMKKTLVLPPSQQYLQQEVENVLDACAAIKRDIVKQQRIAITVDRIKEFNALVLRKLPLDEEIVPGEFRRFSVGVFNYRGVPWKDCEKLTSRLSQWLDGGDFESTEPRMKFALSLLKAVVAQLYIAWIHPFGDGNGRTARLIEFQILAQSGMVSLPAAHLLSNHYNITRARYYSELDRSSKVDDGPIRFFEYACEGFVDGLREQLKVIQEQQLQVTWEKYIQDQFHDRQSPAVERLKHILIDMPAEFISRREIMSVSSRVTREYAIKSEKTLTRDLNLLLRKKLVIRAGTSYKPNRELILAFLPPNPPVQTLS